MDILSGMNGLPDTLQQAVMRQLQNMALQTALEAERRQLALAREREESRTMDGVGQHVMRMDMDLFLALKRQGFDFGSAKERKWALDRYPGTQVECQRRILIGWEPNKRMSKRYAEG